jgi:hypothetical protein
LRAEGFSFSVDVLYGGLGISKLQFLIWKRYLFSAVFFLHFFGHQNSGSGLGTDSLEMLDPDPYPDSDSVNLDAQHRVGKNPGLKKNPAQWVYLVFLGFLGFLGFGFFCPDERVLGFFQFHEYF